MASGEADSMINRTGRWTKSERGGASRRTTTESSRVAWHKKNIKQHLAVSARENRALDFLYGESAQLER